MSVRSIALRYVPLVVFMLVLMKVAPINSGLPRLISLQSTGIILSFSALGLFFVAELIRTQKYKLGLFLVSVSSLAALIVFLNLAQLNATVFNTYNYPLFKRENLDLETMAKGDAQRQIRNLAHTLYQLRPDLRAATIWVPDQPPLGSVYWSQYALAGAVKSYLAEDAPLTRETAGQTGLKLPIDDERSMIFYRTRGADTYVLKADEMDENLFHLVALAEQ